MLLYWKLSYYIPFNERKKSYYNDEYISQIMKRWKNKFGGFVIQFVLVCAPWTFHAGITWQLHGRLPCTNNLLYWLFVIYEYV